jgi:hypothetical protein
VNVQLAVNYFYRRFDGILGYNGGDKIYPNAMRRRGDNWDVICPVFKYSPAGRRALPLATRNITRMDDKNQGLGAGLRGAVGHFRGQVIRLMIILDEIIYRNLFTQRAVIFR